MSLTVIVPTRNRPREIKKLIHLLLKNSVHLQKIIIVDSSDNFNHKINRFSNINIIYKHTQIKSAAIQRNIGMSMVDPRCKFLAFLDDDVTPSKNYFADLINTLKLKKAIGVSGVAINPKLSKKYNDNKIFAVYRRIFFLDSDSEGCVLLSGINIPFKASASNKQIRKSEWLIGCAVWDYQKIKNYRFNNSFYGQSLGEDVLFSLQASSLGKLYVNQGVKLVHSESSINRPNHFTFSRMWIRNRFYIVEELSGTRFKYLYHWANLGKVIYTLIFFLKNPIKYASGFFGILAGYSDLIRDKHES